MEAYLNQKEMRRAFSVPLSVAEKHLKLADEIQLKVLLYFCAAVEFEPEEASNALSISVGDITDALLYWNDMGVISLPKKETAEVKKAEPVKKKEPKKRIVKPQPVLPSREEIAKLSVDDPTIGEMLNIISVQLGKSLSQSEMSAYVWLYKDNGISIPLIQMVISYVMSIEKYSVRYVQKIAEAWIDEGIESVSEAEAKICKLAQCRNAWGIAKSAFGLEYNKPTDKQIKEVDKWINEWGYDKSVLSEAYNRCVDSKSNFSFAYTAKIIESWHTSGVKTTDDIASVDKKSENSNKSAAGYNIDLAESQMLEKYRKK